MQISSHTKQLYKDDSIHKYIKLQFPELRITINNDQIYSESLSLKESMMERSSVEFVGCIASCFKIKVHDIKKDIKGKRIIATIWTDGSEDEPIELFDGVVDSCIRDSNKRSKEITAYDKLYTAGNTDVANWYQSLRFPITIGEFRHSLFRYLRINEEPIDLANDNIAVEKIYDPKTLQALTVLKSICQINGVMGIINRKGNFEYRILSDIVKVPYPSLTLFPSNTLFPAQQGEVAPNTPDDDIEAELVAYYRSLDFEEYTVRPVDRVVIRDNEDDTGVSYGSGENKYIIQNNMFAKKLDEYSKQTMARNIYNNIEGVEFTPFNSTNNGFPWLECGKDAISCQVYNYDFDETKPVSEKNLQFIDKTFYVLNRDLSGVQALKDNYNVSGDEYQSEFITDLNANIDLVKENASINISDYTYDFDQIDSKFADVWDAIEGSYGFDVVSTKSIPSDPKGNTIYLIQGEVVII